MTVLTILRRASTRSRLTCALFSLVAGASASFAASAQAQPVTQFEYVGQEYGISQVVGCPSGAVFALDDVSPSQRLFVAYPSDREPPRPSSYRPASNMGGALSISCDSQNGLWAFNTDRTLWHDVSGNWGRYEAAGGKNAQWVRISSLGGARQFAAGAGALWALNDDGSLWRSSDGLGWVKVGDMPGADQIAATGNHLYVLNYDKTLWVSPHGGAPGPWFQTSQPWAARTIGNGVMGPFVINNDRTLFIGITRGL